MPLSPLPLKTSRLIRSLPLIAGICLLAAGASARPPLFLLDQDRLDEIRQLVTEPGTTHHEAFQAMLARVDANDIPGTSTGLRCDFAREAAMAYLITENAAYAQAAWQRLEEIYTISLPAGDSAPDAGSGLARAQGIASFATAYNWAYDGWTPEQRDWVRGILDKALDEYEGEALSHPNIGYQSNNSNWSGVVAGAHVATLIALDLHNERRWDFQRSRELLRTHLASFGTRGWTQEGNYYFVLSMEYLMPAMLALRQIGDPHVEPSFASRRPHHITMYAAMFNAGQNSLTWGVGGDTLPPYGMTSALLGLVPEGEKGFYRWFYDRYRGILNPAPAAEKYDHKKAGTPFALIAYPNDVPARDPAGHYPSVIHDNLGGYVLRSGWEDEDDTIVGLWSDTNNYGRSWNQRDAGQINILSHGAKWGYGPGPATSGLDATFSQILVNGVARTDTGQGAAIEHRVAPAGGYAMVSGGSKFANLGVSEAIRHVLADFSAEGHAIISTFDRLRSNEAQTYGWNLYLPGKTVSIGTDEVNDIDYLHAVDANGAYLRAWFIVHGNGFIEQNQATRYEYDGTDADIWVVIATGRGAPPAISVAGVGLEAAVTVGDTVLTYDAAAQRIQSSALTGLNATVNPSLSASPASGEGPLNVSFGASGTADPGETLAYAWDFGDGSTSTAQNTAHTYTDDGIYLVSLEVADAQGGTDRMLRSIFVGNREPSAHIASSHSIVLPTTPVTLSGSASSDPEGDPLIYEWDLGDGRVMAGETIEAGWSSEGVYRVTLKVTDSAGLINVARTQIRVENQSPVGAFSADSIGGFVPFTVHFVASASYDPEGEPLLYRWDFDDGTIVETNDPQAAHEFTQTKDHRVRLTVFDPEGKSGTTTDWITALGLGDILPAVADPGGLAQGLNYQVYRGDPGTGASLPQIATLRPLNGGRVQHFDHDVTDLDQLYVLVFSGYLHAPETGAYAFRMRTQQQSRLRVGGQQMLLSNFPHSGAYEGLVALEAGLHPYRIEINYAPEFPGSTWPTYSLLWSPPGADTYVPIPDDRLSSPVGLFQPTLRATPTTVYDGGTVQFEATVISPDGAPLSYFWEFGDGRTSTAPSVAHAYQLSSNDDHRVYNAKLTVTDGGGNAITVGEPITVSRYAGLVMSPRDSIRRNRYAFDRRGAPRDTTAAVNHAREPGAEFTFSSELRPDLGGAMLVDGSYQTRWVSAQPQDWVKFSFKGKDGSPKRYNIREYAFTSGGLGWTTHRDPLEWEVYGSNKTEPAAFSMEPGAANPSWTLIDSVSGQSGEARILPIIYSLPNTEAYAHYLFHLRNQSGGIETELELTEIQVFSYFEGDASLDGNQPPVPVLEASAAEVHGPLPIDFDALGTTDPDGDWLYYTWDFGDGHVHQLGLEDDFRTHTFYQPGEYEVTLTVTDARGLAATASTTITVLPPQPNTPPVPDYTTSAEAFLVGTQVVLDAGTSYDPDGDALHFRWEFGDGVHAEDEVVTHTWYKPGVYNPVLIVTDERGRKSAFFKEIEILPPNGGRGVISFNFNRQPGRLNPNRGAGVVPVAYWNDIWQPWATDWYDSSGDPVDLLLTATGRQSSFSTIYPVPAFDGDAQLGARSEGKTPYGSDEGFSWEIANIPYSVYDVYIYFGGSFADAPRAVLVNGEPRYVRKLGHGFSGEWRLSEATAPEQALPGHDLLVWSNLTDPAFIIEMPTRQSDGIAGFQIVDKTGSPDAPPVTTIITPADGAWFTVGDSIHLSGISEGPDGPLDDPFLRWDSSIDGFLGNGASLTLSTLSTGTHTISLTGTNDGNLSMTESVVIEVFPIPAAPAFDTQPADVTTYETATIQFSVEVTGSPPVFSYQWRRDGQPLEDGPGIDGSDTAVLTLSNIGFGAAGFYDVVVTNDTGAAHSEVAELIVTELVSPGIGEAPVGGVVDMGADIVLAAQITGSRPMQFRWHFNGTPLENNARIQGADTETLVISNASSADAGQYQLAATNAGGSLSTGEIEVMVNLPPVITVLRPVGGIGAIPLGAGAWLRVQLADDIAAADDLQLDWTWIDGPAGVAFTDPFAAETGVVFSATGEYVVRLTASDGSLESSRDIILVVRDDLDGVSAPVGPPLVNDFFDWGPSDLSNTQIPAGSGWRFGTNSFSYVGGRSATWAGSGDNPYVLFGDPTSGGLIRGNVKHHPRGIQRDFPATVSGQRWLSVLVWLESGWDNDLQTAVFSLGNFPTYSYGGIRGQGFGFHNDGAGLRLAALDQATPVAQAGFVAARQKWLLIIAKTVVNPDGPDSISLWTLDADASFGVTESSLGPPHLHYDGYDWGAGYDNVWIGAHRPNGPNAVFEFDELRASTEGGDRGLGQVLAEPDNAIQIGPMVAIDAVGPVEPDTETGLTGHANDPDSHPQPLALQWRTAAGPAPATFSDPASASPSAVFPLAGSYRLRLVADDGAVATFAQVAVSVGDVGPSGSYAAWMDGYANDIPPESRGPLDDFSADGILNIIAYAFDLDPRQRLAGRQRQFVQLSRDGHDLVLSLPIPQGLQRPDLHYQVRRSTDLASWATVAEAIGSTDFLPLGPEAPAIDHAGDTLSLRFAPQPEARSQYFFILEITSIGGP
jgi:PKD repeat protein